MITLSQSLDRFVPEVLRITGTPGLCVAVRHHGEVIERAYGWADLAARRPLSTACRFPAGSMTKLLTAIAVLQQLEAGAAALHDPVNRNLDGVDCTNPLGAREVTIHDLLTFRSGLSVDTTACRLSPPPPLIDHVRDSLATRHGQEYAGAPPRWSSRVGERYHYANLGISVLGLLVEQLNSDGLALPEYMERHILEPLEMNRSELIDFSGDPPDDVATGYSCFHRLQVPTPWIRSGDFPANGFVTTPGDYLRVLCALLEGGEGVLDPASVDLMLTPQVRMDEGDGLWPGPEWWTGLVAIMSNLGRRDAHFGHPGSHMWGWWNTSRAYPELDCAVVACANGWDMMRWQNPSNPEATALVADHVAAYAGGERREPASWAWERSHLAGAILAERTYGLLGISERLDDAELRAIAARAVSHDGWKLDAFLAGARAGRDRPLDASAAGELLAVADREALMLDLGAVYGCPAPLWFWHGADPAAAAWAATARRTAEAIAT